MNIIHTIKRQPALVVALIVSLLGFLATLQLTGLNAEQSGAIIAAITVGAGFLGAKLSRDKGLNVLTSFVKACVYVGVTYGLNINQETQAALVPLVEAVGVMFIWPKNVPEEPPGVEAQAA